MSIKNCCPFSLIRIQTFAVTLAPGLGNHFTITVLSSSSPGSMLDQFELVTRTTKTDCVCTDCRGGTAPKRTKGR